MAIQTFELVSPFLSIYAPSKVWKGDNSLLLGQTANALSTGEILKIDGATYGVLRASATQNDGTAVTITTAPGFAYFSETGRGDVVTSGNVPILQFGPYEADTMIFERDASGVLTSDGTGGTPLSTSDVGKPVGIFGVRHHKDFATADFGTGLYIQSGLGCLNQTQIAAGAKIVGYISRITGVGSKMRVRILFGI